MFSVIAVVRNRDLQPPWFGYWDTHAYTRAQTHTHTSKEDKQACYSHYEVLRSKQIEWAGTEDLAGKGDWLGFLWLLGNRVRMRLPLIVWISRDARISYDAKGWALGLANQHAQIGGEGGIKQVAHQTSKWSHSYYNACLLVGSFIEIADCGCEFVYCSLAVLSVFQGFIWDQGFPEAREPLSTSKQWLKLCMQIPRTAICRICPWDSWLDHQHHLLAPLPVLMNTAIELLPPRGAIPIFRSRGLLLAVRVTLTLLCGGPRRGSRWLLLPRCCGKCSMML